MLAFVIPFKPKLNSKNWESDSLHLKNTIASILRQTDDCFQVFVVLHEMPIAPLLSEKVSYLTFPGEYCVYQQLEDGSEQLAGNTYLKEKDVEYLFDQGRKQMYGARTAIENGFEYIMCVDADDLVSKHVARYVKENKCVRDMGWFVDKGFYFIKDEDVYVKRPYAMNLYNGSTHIVHHAYIPVWDVNALSVRETNFFSAHAYLTRRLKDLYGKALQPLPFYAIIYVVTNQNWSISVAKIKGKSVLQYIKFLMRKVIFRQEVYKNF